MTSIPTASEADVLAEARTVLVLAPSPTEPDRCPSWLTGGGAEMIDVSTAPNGDRPASDSAASRRPMSPPPGPPVRLDLSVDGALAADGLTVLDRLSAVDPPGTQAVCVDGLSDVLRRHGTEAAFRVTVALRAVIHGRSGSVHVHIDPATADARTLRILATPFDAVVRFEPDGPVIVRAADGDPLS